MLGPTDPNILTKALISTQTLKPIFHLKTGLRWVPDANEIYTKNMKCTCPTRKFCVGTQRNLYSTGLRLGFASGKTQLLGFASGKNAKNWRHLTQKIPTCWYPQRKSLASGLLPNANPRHQNFASQWNIGLRVRAEMRAAASIFD